MSQGDREGRPYNTRWRVKQTTWYCTGDPRGRPYKLCLGRPYKLCRGCPGNLFYLPLLV